MLDGLRIVDMMRGRREKGIASDRELLALFAKGWRTKLSLVYARIKKRDAEEQEWAGHKSIRELQAPSATNAITEAIRRRVE